MFCKNCGSKLPDGAIFCPSCGAKIGNSQMNNNIPAGKNQQNGNLNHQPTNSTNRNQSEEDIYRNPTFRGGGNFGGNYNPGGAAGNYGNPGANTPNYGNQGTNNQVYGNQNKTAQGYGSQMKTQAGYGNQANSQNKYGNQKNTQQYGYRGNPQAQAQAQAAPLNPGEVRTFKVSSFHKYFLIGLLSLAAVVFFVCLIFFFVSLQSFRFKYLGDGTGVFISAIFMVLMLVAVAADLITFLAYNKLVLNISETGISGVGGKYMYLTTKSFNASYSEINSVTPKFSGLIARNNRIVIRINGEKYDLTVENGMVAKQLIDEQIAKNQKHPY